MIKKELGLLIVFLISLPGCGGGRKKTSTPKGKKMAFSRVAMPLADGEADGSPIRSFFDDDMQDFTAFNREGEAGNPDRYAWLNRTTSGFNVAYFDFDKHSISDAEREKAKLNAQKVKKLVESDPEVVVVVEGHACASAGDAAYNLALSEKRAKTYANQLKANGVPSDRLKQVGRGKEMLLVKDGNREEQWMNRRVELHPVHENVAA